MSTMFLVQLLYGALALVMAGLGLSLTVNDFQRLRHQKRGAAVALLVQMLVLPAVALAIVLALDMPPLLAVGMMLLAATPGSISANLYSHLFGGNVAFNVSLTGVNTLLCAFTMPLICGWALATFAGSQADIPILHDKIAEVLAIVLIPVAGGMLVRAKAPLVAAKLAGPVKIASAAVVIVFSLAAIAKEWSALIDGLAHVGVGILLLNVMGLTIGYTAARASRLGPAETITIAFQSSIHNAILALYVALAVLQVPLIALPAAIYSITMNFLALAFGFWVKHQVRSAALTSPDNVAAFPAR